MKILVACLDYEEEIDVPVISVFSKKEFKAIKKASKGRRDEDISISFGVKKEIETTVGDCLDMFEKSNKIFKEEIANLKKFGILDIYGSVDLIVELKKHFNIEVEDELPY